MGVWFAQSFDHKCRTIFGFGFNGRAFGLVGFFTMTHKPIVGSALQIPLFHGLDAEQMSEIVRRAEHVQYEPGEALIEDGEKGEAAILVISGRATQFNAFSTTRPYDPIGPGSLVGEMAMLVETVHHLTVIADEPIKALKFHRPMIEALMGEDPRLADHFVARIASRLNDLAAEMRAAVDPMEQRAPSATADTRTHALLSSTEQPPSASPAPRTFEGLTSSADEPPSFPVN